VLAPRLTTSEVFSSIDNGSGYSSTGLALMVSQSAILFQIVGSDATAHMSEETRQAAVVIPKAMIAAYIVNGGLAFVSLQESYPCLEML
jgi:choline transport protein